MDFNQIKNYWEDRASADTTAQSTTQDYYLREIEFRVLKDLIDKYQPANVLDAGCGDALTTTKLAAAFPHIKFVGADYSASMVRNAQNNIEGAGIKNVRVLVQDITLPLPGESWEMVYSTRCLINLATWELQQVATKNILAKLPVGGTYVMIENFIEGHENFNRLRTGMGLKKIPVREHNLFLERSRLLGFKE
jgi:SAM-dependent methyltransferase